MPRVKPATIWIDGDACPKAVKEIIFKTSRRWNIQVIVVANSFQFLPKNELIKLIVVDQGLDVADQYIIDHVVMHDLVITADIPLAAALIKKQVKVLNPRGEIYNENTMGSILSVRDFMKDLRDTGAITGGPAPFGPKDVKQFADSINRLVS